MAQEIVRLDLVVRFAFIYVLTVRPWEAQVRNLE